MKIETLKQLSVFDEKKSTYYLKIKNELGGFKVINVGEGTYKDVSGLLEGEKVFSNGEVIKKGGANGK